MRIIAQRNIYFSLMGFHRYTKSKISLAPNNASSWNYLRGILEHTRTPWTTLVPFAEPYTESKAPEDDVVDLDNPKPSAEAVLPCVPALDFVAEAYAREKGANVQKAVELWKMLANEQDIMRKKYVLPRPS